MAVTTASASPTNDVENSESSDTKRKHDLFHSDADDSSRVEDVSAVASYRIVDINILKKMIDVLCCSSCSGGKIKLVEETMYGLASKMVLRCTSCKDILFSQKSSDKTTIAELLA